MNLFMSIRLGTGAAVVAALALLAVSTVSAAAPEIKIGSAGASVGGRAAVTLDVLNIPEPGLGAWTIDVVYDQRVVEAVSCTATQDALSVCNPTYDDQIVRVTGATIDGLAGDHALASMTFECTAVGATVLTVSISVLVDATVGAPGAMPTAVTNGGIACAAAPTVEPSATSAPRPTPGQIFPIAGGGPLNSNAWGPFGWLIAGLAGAGLAWIASGAFSAAFAPVPSSVAGSSPRPAPPNVSEQRASVARETNVIRLHVRDIDDFSAFTNALAKLGRAPGVRGVRAVRLERREGVFDVAVAQPMTSATLARVAERALGRRVRVESES